jgi:hypothetical protein
MYTIDTLIERLVDLREKAHNGGRTRVAIGGSECMQPPAIVEITGATLVDGICGTKWKYTVANNTELVRIM